MTIACLKIVHSFPLLIRGTTFRGASRNRSKNHYSLAYQSTDYNKPILASTINMLTRSCVARLSTLWNTTICHHIFKVLIPFSRQIHLHLVQTVCQSFWTVCRSLAQYTLTYGGGAFAALAPSSGWWDRIFPTLRLAWNLWRKYFAKLEVDVEKKN
jgi:hypothetical protein